VAVDVEGSKPFRLPNLRGLQDLGGFLFE